MQNNEAVDIAANNTKGKKVVKLSFSKLVNRSNLSNIRLRQALAYSFISFVIHEI